MLTGASQQIISAFEDLGMSPPEIADSFPDYDVVAIKSVLMQFSSKYREAIKEEPSLDFDADEQLEAKNALVRVMRTSEDEFLVARVAQYIRDDGKGRKDITKNLAGLGANIMLLNQKILEAKQAKLRDKQIKSVTETSSSSSKEEVKIIDV